MVLYERGDCVGNDTACNSTPFAVSGTPAYLHASVRRHQDFETGRALFFLYNLTPFGFISPLFGYPHNEDTYSGTLDLRREGADSSVKEFVDSFHFTTPSKVVTHVLIDLGQGNGRIDVAVVCRGKKCRATASPNIINPDGTIRSDGDENARKAVALKRKLDQAAELRELDAKLAELSKQLGTNEDIESQLADKQKELDQKTSQLEALRQKRATEQKIHSLESEIAKLGGDKEGDSASDVDIHSDVDVPKERFHERPSDFGIVVGIGRYENLPEAQFAERDARAVAAHLKALGVPTRNIVLLAGKDATKSRLEAQLEAWLPKNVGADSRVYFYFSGHGAPDPTNGQAYIVPWDGQPEYLSQTAFATKRVYDDLAHLKAKEIVVALDTCFSGLVGRSVISRGTRPLVTRVRGERPLDPRITLLAAAQADQISGTADSQGHGLFTYYLLKALSNSPITAARLYKRIDPEIEDAARRQNRDQRPMLAGPDISIP